MTPEVQTNVLHYGDDHVNLREAPGNGSDAQLLAFEDTWHWGSSAESLYGHLTNDCRRQEAMS